MNCKKDDVAIVVRSFIGNTGKVLTCKTLHPAGYDFTSLEVGPIWETDRNDIAYILGNGHCGVCSTIPDAYLRPIRDQPGNESFVIEARKSIPRSKPATTKGDTITERGELQS